MKQLIVKRQNRVRRSLRRITCTALALTVSLSALAFCAQAFAVNESNIVYRTETTLSEGLQYETFRAEQNGRSQECFLFTYKGGLSTLPILTAGSGIYGRETTTSMARLFEQSAGSDMSAYRVAGGINADFFSMTTGIPMGVMIDGGRILSSDAGENALGILSDGRTVIGKPSIGITLHKEETEADPDTEAQNQSETVTKDIAVNHINKYPSVWGAYLCTPEYGATTHSAESGTELVFRTEEGSFSVGDTVRASVAEVRKDVTNGAIPEDGFVIVIHNNAANAADFAGFEPGDAVSLFFSCAEGWEDAVFAVGGGDILVENGTARTTGFDPAHGGTDNPRTAIGYNEDGEILLFAVDSRTNASKGMKLEELAQTMRELGCVGAMNLDGGGSTTVLVRARDGAFVTANNPADGYERRISNAILFVNTAEADGIPYDAEITPGSPIVYKKSSVPFSVTFYDRSYTPVSADGAEISWISDGGIVTEDGIFTPASEGTGRYVVSAQVKLPYQTDDDTSDDTYTEKIFTISTDVYQVDTLDGIAADLSVPYIPFGGISEPVSVKGIRNGREVWIDPSYIGVSFVRVTEDGTVEAAYDTDPRRCAWGYVDESLSVHNTADADGAAETAYLAKYGFPVLHLSLSFPKATAEEASVYTVLIPVTFGAPEETVMTMEEKSPRTVFNLDGMDPISRLSTGGCGGSAAISVTTQAIAPAVTPSACNPVKRIDLWVKGSLPDDAYAVITCGGKSHTLNWTVTDDFTRLTGWKRISIDTTAIDPNGVRDFVIDSLLASSSRYTLILDDLIYHYGDDLPVFTDISGSWARDSILAAARMGVVSGIPASDGTYRFNPSGSLTRAEFAKMICVFAGLTVPEAPRADELYPPEPETQETEADEKTEAETTETEETAETTVPDVSGTAETAAFTPYLPFADLTEIPEWALPYIKAVTEAGLMRGKSTGETDENGDPVTRFAATETMSRAEVMQVLGALLPAGEDDVLITGTTFADDAAIPAWARTNIIKCVNAGIITGFSDNTIRPAAAITRAEITALLIRVNGLLN